MMQIIMSNYIVIKKVLGTASRQYNHIVSFTLQADNLSGHLLTSLSER